MLADAQFIEYDAQSEMVRQRDTAAIEQYVETHANELNRLCEIFQLPRTTS